MNPNIMGLEGQIFLIRFLHHRFGVWGLLGGSSLVMSRVISRITVVITCVRGLITRLLAASYP